MYHKNITMVVLVGHYLFMLLATKFCQYFIIRLTIFFTQWMTNEMFRIKIGIHFTKILHRI